jgi:hypothetical protein
MYNLACLAEDQMQNLEDLVDRVIEDEMLNQDQVFHQVMVEDHYQVVMNLKQQQEQQPLLVHEIVVESHFNKKKKRNKNKKNSKYESSKNSKQKKFGFYNFLTEKKENLIYLLRSFNVTCLARSSAGNACDCCSGVK